MPCRPLCCSCLQLEEDGSASRSLTLCLDLHHECGSTPSEGATWSCGGGHRFGRNSPHLRSVPDSPSFLCSVCSCRFIAVSYSGSLQSKLQCISFSQRNCFVLPCDFVNDFAHLGLRGFLVSALRPSCY